MDSHPHPKTPNLVLVEVEPNPNGPWDPHTEQELGVFATREAAFAWVVAMLQSEGWDLEEIDQMPPPGTTGSRFQILRQ